MFTLLFTTLLAQAAPGVAHQGRLLDVTGTPVENPATAVTFLLFEQVSGGTPVWSETDTVSVRGGYYSTLLGDMVDLADLDWNGTAYWLGISLDGGVTELGPRTVVGAVPFSLAGGGRAQSLPDDACDGTRGSQGLTRISASDDYQVCALSGSWVTLASVGDELYPFSSHEFTPCDAPAIHGVRFGPNHVDCTQAYSTTWDEDPDFFSMDWQGIQLWTVPATGTYRIRACGGSGGESWEYGSTYPGRAACMQGDFSLAQGDVLQIAVGQAGERKRYTGGGGGGSFVISEDGTPLIIAGGGAGASRNYDERSVRTDATTQPSGRSALQATGGSQGAGGDAATWSNRSGAGGGLRTSGGDGATTSTGGRGFDQRAQGGDCGDCTNAGMGGFGGGGGSYHAEASGGGGGYGGGGGGANFSGSGGGQWSGGGGGSYNTGSNRSDGLSTQTGDGVVQITRL